VSGSSPADLRDIGIGRLSRIVDQLRDQAPEFRRDWDVFRLVYGRPLDETSSPEDDLGARGAAMFPTLNGEMVRSQGEQLIANWLWLNGVAYEYEHLYEHDVADAGHSCQSHTRLTLVSDIDESSPFMIRMGRATMP